MENRAVVRVGQCYGCNRLLIPKPWTPGTMELLRAEGRLRMYEYLCTNDDCVVPGLPKKKRVA